MLIVYLATINSPTEEIKKQPNADGDTAGTIVACGALDMYVEKCNELPTDKDQLQAFSRAAKNSDGYIWKVDNAASGTTTVTFPVNTTSELRQYIPDFYKQKIDNNPEKNEVSPCPSDGASGTFASRIMSE